MNLSEGSGGTGNSYDWKWTGEIPGLSLLFKLSFLILRICFAMNMKQGICRAEGCAFH